MGTSHCTALPNPSLFYSLTATSLLVISFALINAGQLGDLLHILETSGLPSRTNKFIFNGDFVDRGAYGVEVMCTLLALHIAMPGENRAQYSRFCSLLNPKTS